MRRKQISELTHGVNNMLTLYLEVHDEIFAQSWWRSIPYSWTFQAHPIRQIRNSNFKSGAHLKRDRAWNNANAAKSGFV